MIDPKLKNVIREFPYSGFEVKSLYDKVRKDKDISTLREVRKRMRIILNIALSQAISIDQAYQTYKK